MLRIEKINKKLGSFSLRNIDLEVNKGDYFVLIGESGAGKSVLLDLITGFQKADSGSIVLNGRELSGIPIQERNIGIVYQKASLFPHLNVFDNIAYPLHCRKIPKKEIESRIIELASEMDITGLLLRKTLALSGGEAQRVTIARALANQPDILLLDEPLTSLDVSLRKGLLALLRKLNRKGQTIVHVTHDYEEALSLSNKLGLIEQGSILTIASPEEVFRNPKSAFAAGFMGIKNFFTGHIQMGEKGKDLKVFETSGIQISMLSTEETGSKGAIIINNKMIQLSEIEPTIKPLNCLKGTIIDYFKTSNGSEIVIDTGIELFATISDTNTITFEPVFAKIVWLNFDPDAISFSKLS
ncbi:MAG: ABC transporter ATP-binding protein [Bacteroidales bacterium]